jgi:hypothetical protein
VSISHTIELPFFRDSKSALLRTTLGGWAFAGISTFRTGFPVNIFGGSTPSALGGLADVNAALGTGNSVTRPNVSGPINNFVAEAAGSAVSTSVATVNGIPTSTYATSLGLSQPLLGNYGTLGRNVLRLGGQVNFDWDIYKNFHINDKINFQLRGEFYNIFNMHALQGSSPVPADHQSTIWAVWQSRYARTGQVAARIISSVGARGRGSTTVLNYLEKNKRQVVTVNACATIDARMLCAPARAHKIPGNRRQ